MIFFLTLLGIAIYLLLLPYSWDWSFFWRGNGIWKFSPRTKNTKAD